jgi:tRNA 2-thiocytidine biosynthesis protein TtcA
LPTTKLAERLLAQVARASADFRLIEPDDRVMVCMSGGKDSYGMLWLLERVRRRAPFRFSLVAVNLDQGHPGFPSGVLPGWLEREGHEYRVEREDTYSIVKQKVPEGKAYCSLCSRLRRGILYRIALELGATKIALGHHRDDVIETLLLNLFFEGQTKAMPPRLLSDDGRNVVIRPLVYCRERDLAALAEEQSFPIIPCDLCGSQDGLRRQRVKRLIAELEHEIPDVRASLFAALANVRPSHLLDERLERRPDEPRSDAVVSLRRSRAS